MSETVKSFIDRNELASKIDRDIGGLPTSLKSPWELRTYDEWYPKAELDEYIEDFVLPHCEAVHGIPLQKVIEYSILIIFMSDEDFLAGWLALFMIGAVYAVTEGMDGCSWMIRDYSIKALDELHRNGKRIVSEEVESEYRVLVAFK